MISYSVGNGTHLPVLMRVMEVSSGRVAEFGAGFFSTPFLHWKTYLQKRPLVTFENNLEFIKLFDRYQTDWHEVVPVTDWDAIDLSGEWSVALIDHAPKERRIEEIKRLANTCDYLVIHDTQGRRENVFHYRDTLATFKYRKDFTSVRPHTCVVSNRVSLDDLIWP
jgi:hypothetical protein